MEYNFKAIEEKWRKFWKENHTYNSRIDPQKPKYYGLTMFPYPSGAGLHVGHPLGYIASDIYARYKKLKGYNVLHPMGYDSFGLPAEQYAVQTGQHPAVTTEKNLKRYRKQLDLLGFSFDWSREVRTSDPDYYKWTQWIFKQLFNSFYDNKSNKAESIKKLITHFEKEGNKNINAENDCEIQFSAQEWRNMSEKEQSDILMGYRLTYLADSWVNWCPKLGTVLANDEIVNGVSERGGYPVEQKKMTQWSMRITAYADRLLQGLDKLDWTGAIKEIQRNWIGKSVGSTVNFKVVLSASKKQEFEDRKIAKNTIEVFTTRPDTIFGVSFMVLAPEHDLVEVITTAEYLQEVKAYQKRAGARSERERMADTKTISGQFTGAYAIHPLSGEEIPIWIGDYVLASYGTGAVMAVPSGDERDYKFAQEFEISIKNIFENVEVEDLPHSKKEGQLKNSSFLDGMGIKEAASAVIQVLEKKKIGEAKTNYRLRDAVFSRQRYWGEPFPIYYKEGIAQTIEDQFLPIKLPEVDNYLPTSEGNPPLANATQWYWDAQRKELTNEKKANENQVYPMELNTMPGWAGSSWYFLRYMDPNNKDTFVAKEKVAYWKNVDLYIGGAEHATGHLLYARFWTKFLYDRNWIPFDEPFQKMINQGMILGKSSFIYRDKETGKFISYGKRKEFKTSRIHVDINLVENDVLDTEAFKHSRKEYENANFIFGEDQQYHTGQEVEKMSKSKFNVQNPDDLVEKYGADTLRMYEMFLGPIEQAKPWDTQGINGVHSFLRKCWRLFHDADGNINISVEEPKKASLKTLHKTIQKIQEDMDKYVFNTAVSAMMICVNELTEQKCNNKDVLQDIVVLLSPYAPHLAEDLWKKLGHTPGTVGSALFPEVKEEYLVEDVVEYPISFNGKKRFTATFSKNMNKNEIEKEVLAMDKTQKYTGGKPAKKVIVVPGRIVNIVI